MCVVKTFSMMKTRQRPPQFHETPRKLKKKHQKGVGREKNEKFCFGSTLRPATPLGQPFRPHFFQVWAHTLRAPPTHWDNPPALTWTAPPGPAHLDSCPAPTRTLPCSPSSLSNPAPRPIVQKNKIGAEIGQSRTECWPNSKLAKVGRAQSRRSFAVESAAARICREAGNQCHGSRPRFDSPSVRDARRLEVVVDGPLLLGSAVGVLAMRSGGAQ